MNVICDTSFLMVLVSSRIKRLDTIEDELGKLHFLVPDIVLDELRHIQDAAGPKRSMIARTAVKIVLSKFELVRLKQSHTVDDAIVEYAKSNKCAAATLDINLKRKFIQNKILVFTLSKNRLMTSNDLQC